MKLASCLLIAATLIATGPPNAVLAASPDAGFQAEVCSVLGGALPGGKNLGDEAAIGRVMDIQRRYSLPWTEVQLGRRAGPNTCRKPAGRVYWLGITEDRQFAVISGGGRRGHYWVDCFYEHVEGRWRQIACLQSIGFIE